MVALLSKIGRLFGGTHAHSPYAITESYQQIRDFLYTLGDPSLPVHGPYGLQAVLMEKGYPDSVATLAATADGACGLFFSGGAGIVGASAHSGPRTASREMVRQANLFFGRTKPTMIHALPRPGYVKFVLVTVNNLFAAEASEDALRENSHRLTPLYETGQALIQEIRRAEARVDSETALRWSRSVLA